MADRFQGALNQVETLMGQRLSLSNETPQEFLDLVINVSGKRLSHNDAIRILQIFAEQYRKQGRTPAARYCIIEMERILQAKRQESLQETYPLIDFSGSTRPALLNYVNRKRPFFGRLQLQCQKRWILQYTIALCLLMVLLVLVLRLPFFVCFVIGCLLWAFLGWYGNRVQVARMVQRRIKAYYRYLDVEHKKLIKSWRIAVPKARLKKRETLSQISTRNSSSSTAGETREYRKDGE